MGNTAVCSLTVEKSGSSAASLIDCTGLKSCSSVIFGSPGIYGISLRINLKAIHGIIRDDIDTVCAYGKVTEVRAQTRDEIEGAEVVHGTAEALEKAKEYQRCYVIGGASIFEQFFPYIDRAYITKIRYTPESSCFFPNLDEDDSWQCTQELSGLEENGIEYSFCTYERKGD